MNSVRDVLPMLKSLGVDDWPTILEGLRRHLIPPHQVVRYATDVLASEASSSDDLIYLAGADHEPAEHVERLVAALADRAATSRADAVDRLRLATLLVLRRDISDEEQLLRAVADAYSDFGYPSDMAGAVYYMPVDGSAEARVGDQLQSPLVALDLLIADLVHRLGARLESDPAE